jgi:hypothetical protein
MYELKGLARTLAVSSFGDKNPGKRRVHTYDAIT